MTRKIGWLAALTILGLLPCQAQAQRRGSGMVTTPYGQYSMADMAAAGGNPLMAEQMREQKMAMLAEQQAMKQQQLYLQQAAKQQKARQEYLKQHPEVAKAEFEAQAAARAKAMARSKPKSRSVKAKSSATKPEAGKAAGAAKVGSLKAARNATTADATAGTN